MTHVVWVSFEGMVTWLRRALGFRDAVLNDDFKMSTEEPAKIATEGSAVVTCTGRLTAINWREHLQNNWDTFGGGLTKLKLLIICGVHGGEDGNYGGDARNFETCKRQVVSLT